MSSFLDSFRAQAKDYSGKRKPANGHKFRRAVSYSGEFRRIEALPRRDWEIYPEEVAEILTQELRTPSGTMSLWPAQAAALNDIVLERGALLPIGVGQGKALISLLAPVVLQAKRPLLIVPAQLREQTIKHVIPNLSQHWRLPDVRVIGYSELSLAKNKDLLEQHGPDLIILDECHRVKNKKAGRTRRLVRWFREHPETLCVAMSGTISQRSLKDFAHIAEWCLKQRSPLPRSWQELTTWADAIDEKVPDENRAGPGALWRLGDPGMTARECFQVRFVSTPGIIATRKSALGMSLRVERYQGLKIPSTVAALITSTRNSWETPNGDIIMEAVALWRQMRELALGFWYRWDPPPPREWMEARREWKRYVRETLAHNRRALDTELQVWRECAEMDRPPDCWRAWQEIKASFVPRSVAEWVDGFAINECARWLQDGGICWVEHRTFGERLAKVSGLRYYGAGDDSILSTDASAIIASIGAHGEGKNLQRYSRNLVVAPMASGKSWEQLLGRTHREGQQADEVTCEVFLHLPELEASFEQARADARYLEDTFGNRQKLNYADIVL